MKIRFSASWLVFIIATVSAILLAATHAPDAIISFDEGFHGGAVLFLHEALRHVLHIGPPTLAVGSRYLFNEFSNGITLYPPLWVVVATALSFVFGLSTELFRLTTSLFYLATVMSVFWLVKWATSKDVPAVLAAFFVMTTPMVMIYSHLMMLEVPLLLGVTTMVGAFYLLLMDHLPKSVWRIFWLSLLFLLMPLAKLPVVAVAWIINFSFALLGSALYPRSRFYRRCFRLEIVLYLILSFTGLALFISLEKHLWSINMIDFFRSQSEGTKASGNSLLNALKTAWYSRSFYLRDFRHMPILSFIWFGSLAVYGLWKRTPLALLLVIWTAGVYAAFSGVRPQVPQYLMAIYAPLSIAPALLLYELSQFLPGRQGRLLVALGTLGLIIGQVQAMPHSESYPWRNERTGQAQAAAFITQAGSSQDRVLTWHDGTTYAVRLAALQSLVEIANGAQQQCPTALNDSWEWAVVNKDQPPSPSTIDMSILSHGPWTLAGVFGDHNQTVVYRNRTILWPQILGPERLNGGEIIADPIASTGRALRLSGTAPQPVMWGCYRLLPVGQLQIRFRLRAESFSADIANSATAVVVQHTDYPGGDVFDRVVTAGQLRTNPGYQNIDLSFNRTGFNKPSELRIFIYQPLSVLVDSITITK